MITRLFQSTFAFIRSQWWALVLCAVTAVISCVVLYKLVWPAYQDPISRMYTSKLGYASVIRQSGGTFPVTSAKVEQRDITGKFIGEGLVQSEPVQVPMVAMANICLLYTSPSPRDS